MKSRDNKPHRKCDTIQNKWFECLKRAMQFTFNQQQSLPIYMFRYVGEKKIARNNAKKSWRREKKTFHFCLLSHWSETKNGFLTEIGMKVKIKLKIDLPTHKKPAKKKRIFLFNALDSVAFQLKHCSFYIVIRQVMEGKNGWNKTKKYSWCLCFCLCVCVWWQLVIKYWIEKKSTSLPFHYMISSLLYTILMI